MRKLIALFVVVVVSAAGSALAAQTPAPDISSPDASSPKTHDRSSGWVRLRLPSPNGAPSNPGPEVPPPANQPVPPSEGEDIPPSAPPPEDDPPTWGPEPVMAKFAFLLDASGSMHGLRIATVRAETVSMISQLTEENEFDIAAYGSQFPASQHFSKFMWGALLPATEGNKASAIAWVNGPSTNPGGMTPTYPCLKRACEIYPADLDQLFLLTDGYPNWPSGQGSAQHILADFPGWWNKFEHCHLVCICIGGVGSAQQFMQQLAALAGGTYISA